MNIYSIGILFIFLNFIFNSTSGLIMLQILMTLLALTYRSEKDVQKFSLYIFIFIILFSLYIV